jgi:endonuclease/exonuclease/phosphatase (EEP) superfamily protein YafD
MMATNHQAASSRATVAELPTTTVLTRSIVRMIRAVGLGAATLSLLGFAGAFARTADLASNFRVLYAFAMVPAVATYLPELRRMRWRPGALAFALVLDCAAIAVLYFPSRTHRAVRPANPSIRLLQFNTWLENSEVQDVLALVGSERFDVISLQETSESLHATVTRKLADRYRILTAGPDLLLVRRDEPSTQLLRWTRHELPQGAAIEARLNVDGQELAVLSLHAMAPLGPARAATRDLQFEWVAHWCRASSQPVIILGDLNATPWSYAFSRLLQDGGVIDSSRGFGVQPTWRTRCGPLSGVLLWPAQIPIDHCLHSPGLVTIARETGPACGSNHFPLLIKLQLAGAADP